MTQRGNAASPRTTVLLTAAPNALGEVLDLAEVLSQEGRVNVEIVKVSAYHWELRCGDKVQDYFVLTGDDLY